MGKEHLFLGITGILVGIILFIKQPNEIILALVPFLIGLALIIFSKQENKIEEREDKPKKKLKKKK